MMPTPEPVGASPLRIGTLLGGVVLAAVVVFGLGVMVGKRVAGSGQPAPAPSLPTAPAASLAPARGIDPAPAALIPPEKLTFYDRLSGAAPPHLPPLPEDQPPSPSAAQVPASQPEPAASRELPATRPPAATPVPAGTGSPAERVRRLGGPGPFAVQVAAVNDRASARGMEERIRGEGFEVETSSASVKGKVWYRVRVGSFPSRETAEQAAGVFRSAFGYDAIPVQK